MKYLVLFVLVSGCSSSVTLDGIWQFDVTGDIAATGTAPGACAAGMISGSGQVQIVDNAGSFGADAKASCIAPPGEGCDLTPCLNTMGFDCSFADNGDATCTASVDGGATIANAFLLGTCTSSACTITAATLSSDFSNVSIALTRQR
jgi:hypothetical protein